VAVGRSVPFTTMDDANHGLSAPRPPGRKLEILDAGGIGNWDVGVFVEYRPLVVDGDGHPTRPCPQMQWSLTTPV
jgi:hypothetical protein